MMKAKMKTLKLDLKTFVNKKIKKGGLLNNLCKEQMKTPKNYCNLLDMTILK